MSTTLRNLITVLSLSITLLASAQETRIHSEDGLFHHTPKGDIHINDFDPFIRRFLKLEQNDQLIQVSSDVDISGNSHIKFELITSGLKRDHETIIVHTNPKGIILFINGEYVPVTNLQVKPSINESSALGRALNHINAEKNKWEKPGADAGLYPKGELLIYNGSLVYKFIVSATVPESSNEVYVDAHTGNVLRTSSMINHDTGFAHTRYSGVQSIETHPNGNSFQLTDKTRASDIETYNLSNSSTDYGVATSYSDNDNTWNEYGSNKEVQDALDAHWAAGQIYDYWLNIHGRKSFDDTKLFSQENGAKIKSYVHYGTNSSGASWDMSTWSMRFGNGGSSFNGKTTLDAVAHEFAHGVDQFSSALSNYQESGALDEGIADIWATCVEHYVNGLNILPQPKEIWKFQSENIINGNSFRSLDNPNENNHPDTYKGDYWWYGTGDKSGIHTNCTVVGHWFFLASEGGSGVNDHGFSYSVNGVGISKMGQILYEAQKNYFTQNTNYYTARILTTQAAIILFGQSSPEADAVIDAWDAVGVTDILANQPQYCIPEIDTIAYNSEGYSIDVRPEDFYQNQTFPFINTMKIFSANTTYFKTWIDVDHDGTFDPSEEVFSGTYPIPSYEQNFDIPLNTQVGFTRIRHIRSSQPIGTACDNIEKGDIEDIIVNILPSDYGACAPYGRNKYINGPSYAISWMKLESIENSSDYLLCDHNGSSCLSSAFSNTGYNPMPLPTYDVTPGSSYKIGLGGTHQYNPSLAEAHWEVWIDYNQDKVFEESELILKTSVSSSNIIHHNFDIPFSALPGETRMRVKVRRYNSPEGPCGDIGLGEVEDYKINILPCEPSAPTGIKVAHLPNSLSAKIFWNSANGDYRVRVRPTSDNFWESITNTNSTKILQQFDHPGTAYIVQVGTVCQGQVAWSSSIFTQTNCTIPQNEGVSHVTSSSAQISWDGQLDKNGQMLDYVIFAREEPTDPFYPYWAAYYVNNDDNYQLTGLKANTNYQFKVRSQCEIGSSNFTEVGTFKTKYKFFFRSGFDNTTNAVTENRIENLNGDVTLYPNPVQDRLKLVISNTKNPRAANILDVSGRIIQTILIDGNTSSHDMSQLKPGTYFISIKAEEKRYKVRFIKN